MLLGLIGAGIAASRTPAMHEAAGRAAGLPLVYRRIDVDLGPRMELPEILLLAEWLGFDGLNITYPYKQQIVPLLHELSDSARGIGAVNTVVLRDGRRIGHNTDCWGFAEAFRAELAGVPRRRVLQLGAGGAGSATAYALLRDGVGELVLVDPKRDRAEALAADLARVFGADRVSVAASAESGAAGCDGIVNASPVGMDKMPGTPLPVGAIPAGAWVVDIIYFPIESRLLADARAAGHRVMNGSGMALKQAVRAFELFTGHQADEEVMRNTFAMSPRPFAATSG